LARSKQSLKRHRTDVAKAKRNRSRIRAIRTAMKKARAAEDPEEKKKLIAKAQKLLDKAARKRLLHNNKAKRLKSSLMKKS